MVPSAGYFRRLQPFAHGIHVHPTRRQVGGRGKDDAPHRSRDCGTRSGNDRGFSSTREEITYAGRQFSRVRRGAALGVSGDDLFNGSGAVEEQPHALGPKGSVALADGVEITFQQMGGLLGHANAKLTRKAL